MGDGKNRRLWVVCCWCTAFVLLIVPLLSLSANSPIVVLGALFLLGWVLPGWLLCLSWRLPGLDWAEVGGISLVLGFAWGLLSTWAVHLLPGPITTTQLLSAYEGGSAVLTLVLLRRPPTDIARPRRRVWAHLLFVVMLAACFRLPGLGYAELHTDEAVVLTRAFQALGGQDDVLLYHKKGPAEIIVSLIPYAALGTVTEAAGRLPFALAAITNVALLYLLGRRLFTPEAGLAAGLLLAINGYALGHTRIVQNEGLVMLFMTFSFFAAYGFARDGNSRWLPLVALSSGVGTLAHYESLMMVPALVLLIAWGWRTSPVRFRVVLQAAGIFLAIFLVAYAPLAINRHFAGTQRYLYAVAGSGLYWNGPFFLENATWYNSTYYFVGLLLLLAAGMVLGWRQARLTTAALIVWFLPFLGVFLFIMRFPGTHFFTMMPSWSLLGGYGLTRGMSILRESRWWWPVAAAGGLWCTLCVGYLYLTFFQQSPEYMQDYAANRVPLYWAPYGDDVPVKPRFGFPNQAGWKVIGLLYDWNYLQGTYGSNEGGRFLRWYLRHAQRGPQPDYYFVSQTIQMPNTEFDAQVLSMYQHVGEVRVHGQPKIRIYARNPAPFPYLVYETETFAPIFDRVIPAMPAVRQMSTTQGLGFRLGESIWLRRYDRDAYPVHPGDVLHLILYWETEAPIAQDYKVFVHLGEGPVWGQHDAMPEQNTYPTSRWHVGEQIVDHVVIPIKPTAPPGTYPLLVGMYRWEDGSRLPVYDAAGNPQGDHILLGTIHIH